jgi:TRAP-type C4-dicarboxylate transport system substrate-binding protein
MMRAHHLFCAIALSGTIARAEPHNVLKLATVAPEGTAWARELHAFSREVEAHTQGELSVKWYLGGIAGDDVQVGERIKRGQLDGAASGGMLCQELSPSMRVMRVHGVFQSRDEGAYVLSRLAQTFEQEFERVGYVLLSVTGLGPEVVFTRKPVRTFEDLKRTPMWRWDLDKIGALSARELGENIVVLPLEEAAHAYDEGRIDGFFGIPAAALAFQWTSRPLYLLDLRTSYLWGCLAVTARAFAKLPPDQQQALRASGAKLSHRFEEIGRQQDDSLLNGLFARQGVKSVAVDSQLQKDFLAAARAARERLGDKLLPRALLDRVLAMLADYRAEHGQSSPPK